MDEPLSNLDAKLRHSARREFKRLHAETGVTTIYVTHDQVEAMGLGQRVAIMNFGKIKQIGTPPEIYHEPRSTFVAQLMGSPPMTLLPDGDRLDRKSVVQGKGVSVSVDLGCSRNINNKTT